MVIFLVEDNPADVLLVREALDEHRVAGELLVVTDGERAIQFIHALDQGAGGSPPVLAIVDLSLPKRSGREVLGALRASRICGLIPIVVLSTSDARRDKEDAARLGATRYLCKPSRLDDFLALGEIFKAMINGRDT